MAEEKPETLQELLERRNNLLMLQEAMQKRLENISREERLEVEVLSKRAINPECAFDRKHSTELYKLALFPNDVTWHFKLRERLHRIIHHH